MQQHWIGWILASCVVLSLYDLSKKASVRGNAVFPNGTVTVNLNMRNAGAVLFL